MEIVTEHGDAIVDLDGRATPVLRHAENTDRPPVQPRTVLLCYQGIDDRRAPRVEMLELAVRAANLPPLPVPCGVGCDGIHVIAETDTTGRWHARSMGPARAAKRPTQLDLAAAGYGPKPPDYPEPKPPTLTDAQRRARSEAIIRLHREGMAPTAIAERLDCDARVIAGVLGAAPIEKAPPQPPPPAECLNAATSAPTASATAATPPAAPQAVSVPTAWQVDTIKAMRDAGAGRQMMATTLGWSADLIDAAIRAIAPTPIPRLLDDPAPRTRQKRKRRRRR